MAAIGRVESGRRDSGTGEVGAWPWTINAEGEGSFFENKADAIKAVLGLQARGVHSIDVGCMQVNLLQHPTAFPNLDMAFEPEVNADYAARFLVQLHNQTGDWVKATAGYHSGNPWEGNPYAAKVTAVWPEEQRKAGLNPPPIPAPAAQMTHFASAYSPFPGHQPPRILAMAVLRPGVTPAGTMTLAMLQANASTPIPSPGQIPHIEMVQPAAKPSGPLPGQIMRPPLIRVAAPAQPASSPGRGLDSYRAAPVRMVMLTHLTARMPFGVMTR
jgi:hypothetical protein